MNPPPFNYYLAKFGFERVRQEFFQCWYHSSYPNADGSGQWNCSVWGALTTAFSFGKYIVILTFLASFAGFLITPATSAHSQSRLHEESSASLLSCTGWSAHLSFSSAVWRTETGELFRAHALLYGHVPHNAKETELEGIYLHNCNTKKHCVTDIHFKMSTQYTGWYRQIKKIV